MIVVTVTVLAIAAATMWYELVGYSDGAALTFVLLGAGVGAFTVMFLWPWITEGRDA